MGATLVNLTSGGQTRVSGVIEGVLSLLAFLALGTFIAVSYTHLDVYKRQHLVAEVQELTDEVCATVDALVDSYRQRMPWSEQPSTGDQEQSVSWHEGRADRLSMQLLKTILADDAMNVEIKLPLAQFIEEIDRVADQAEGIDKELRFSRTRGLSPVGRKDTH